MCDQPEEVYTRSIQPDGRFHVKHIDHLLTSELTDYALLAGVPLNEAQARLLVAHILLVLEANTRLNLTRIQDPVACARLHAVDSLSALPELSQSASGRLIDLGTGAGYPGIPLAVLSGRSAVLLDSVKKKARELEGIVSELGLSGRVSVEAERAEAHSRDSPGTYGVVTARAVSELPALVELASPLLMMGGALIAMKGSPSREELRRGDAAAAMCGMSRVSTREFELPAGEGARTIVRYERVGTPSVLLPRREGLAQNSPLA